jgi:hypothetical protein
MILRFESWTFARTTRDVVETSFSAYLRFRETHIDAEALAPILLSIHYAGPRGFSPPVPPA